MRKESHKNDLQVVEFSMMPEHMQGLAAALTPYVNKGIAPPEERLKAIVGEHLPKPMMEELQGVPTSGQPVVYVMHKLPEVQRERITNHFMQPVDRGKPRTPCPNMADLIAKGVLLNMRFRSTGNNELMPRKSSKAKSATAPHKDGFHVSAFSSVINDQQAPKRFTNWKAVIEEASRMRSFPRYC